MDYEVQGKHTFLTKTDATGGPHTAQWWSGAAVFSLYPTVPLGGWTRMGNGDATHGKTRGGGQGEGNGHGKPEGSRTCEGRGVLWGARQPPIAAGGCLAWGRNHSVRGLPQTNAIHPREELWLWGFYLEDPALNTNGVVRAGGKKWGVLIIGALCAAFRQEQKNSVFKTGYIKIWTNTHNQNHFVSCISHWQYHFVSLGASLSIKLHNFLKNIYTYFLKEKSIC